MTALRFDFRDLLKSARLAFSFQRLWIQTIGLGLGYLAYAVLTYIALILSGQSFGTLWVRFGLLPCAIGQYLPWYGWVLTILGIVILVFSWLITATAVSRAVYMHLKGNTFYTWREAFRFALKKKGPSVLSTPLVILIIAVLIGVGGLIVGLAGRIPYVGELGISLFGILWFLASLLLVFILLAFCVSLILTPAVLSTTDDDAFEGIFQSFSTLFGQPWRFILYEIFLIVIAVVSFAIFALIAKQAWLLMTQIFVMGMGDKYADLSYSASTLLQNWVYPAVAWSRALLGNLNSLFFFSRDFSSMSLPAVMTIASWILAIFMTIIGGFILCYPLAIFNTGNCLIFLILKKKKDDENLLERKDKEEEEEETEPAEEKKEAAAEEVKTETVKKTASAAKPKNAKAKAAKSKPTRTTKKRPASRK